MHCNIHHPASQLFHHHLDSLPALFACGGTLARPQDQIWAEMFAAQQRLLSRNSLLAAHSTCQHRLFVARSSAAAGASAANTAQQQRDLSSQQPHTLQQQQQAAPQVPSLMELLSTHGARLTTAAQMVWAQVGVLTDSARVRWLFDPAATSASLLPLALTHRCFGLVMLLLTPPVATATTACSCLSALGPLALCMQSICR